MKTKLLSFTIILTILLSVFAYPVLAAKQVVDITRPEESTEVVSKSVFMISGNCLYDETTITFQYWDTDAKEYKPLETTDGSSTFKVGSGKIFAKNVELKYTGENQIKIISYTKATKDEPQENIYTITVGKKKEDSNWIDKAMDWLGLKKE